MSKLDIDGDDLSLADLFDDGIWLNTDEIPIISADTDNKIEFSLVSKWLTSFLFADVVNFAWKQQNVFIMSYEMDEETCKSSASELTVLV